MYLSWLVEPAVCACATGRRVWSNLDRGSLARMAGLCEFHGQ